MQSSFQLKQKVHACLDGVYQSAVVEQIEIDERFPENTKYYVHWAEHDRRMDRWLKADLMAASKNSSSKGASSKGNGGIPVNAKMISRGLLSPADHGNPAPKSRTSTVLVSATSGAQRARQDSAFFCRPKNVQKICMGRWVVDAWYFSPYHASRPEVLGRLEDCCECLNSKTKLTISSSPADEENESEDTLLPSTLSPANFTLQVCPFCAEAFLSKESMATHLSKVCRRHPPGNEIYRDTLRNIICFECDGKMEPFYCQNLGRLSKMFLEHKAIDYDMTPFVFFTVCEIGKYGCEIMAYFSREKQSPDNYNLSCILTLPQFQGRGVGRFLVEMSYEMSRREDRFGSPEKPLSDLGERTYYSFWLDTVIDALILHDSDDDPITVEKIMKRTGMTQHDVSHVLHTSKILDTKSANYCLHLTPELIKRHREKKEERRARIDMLIFEKSLLSWDPSSYVLMTASTLGITPGGYFPRPTRDEDEVKTNEKKRVRT